LCKQVVQAIQVDPITFSLTAWIEVINTPRDTRPPPPNIEKIIRIATTDYKPLAGDTAGAASGGGTRNDDADQVLIEACAGGNVHTVVDNPVRLRLAFEALEGAEAVAVDLEGVNLGDAISGIITSVQLCQSARGVVYIFDLLALGACAFQGPYSLRELLQDPNIPKLFWDCRTDGRALFQVHGVKLEGVVDLQLLQVACFAATGVEAQHVQRVQGLGRAIDKALVCHAHCLSCLCSPLLQRAACRGVHVFLYLLVLLLSSDPPPPHTHTHTLARTHTHLVRRWVSGLSRSTNSLSANGDGLRK
jgi:hypothetical protein